MALTVPALSSLPGANHTIFLDFDGHVTTGTLWNNPRPTGFNIASINSPAYDTNNDALNFSSSELADIEEAWKRVSEDFFPFQVNVTTVDPGIEALRKVGSTDTKWGIRVVITKDNVNCQCGGISFIGDFSWDSDTPAFVYTTGAKSVAEAASHEVGHSLFLAHDGLVGADGERKTTDDVEYYSGHGSGETAWAPIMGVGYSPNATQWDAGEYLRSNNTGDSANFNHGADDMAVITTYNGFGYRTDDFGNTIASSSPLTKVGSAVSASGVIEKRTDVDVFSFNTGAGTITLNASPFTPGPNLDIKATLYNSSGAVIATADNTASLNATISANVTAGQYYLQIDGTGWGDPTVGPRSGYTDYGSVGRYTISGTVVEPLTDYLAIAATDASKSEGTGGSTNFTFTVTRTGKLTGATSVNYSVSGTGVAPVDGADFIGGSLPTGTIQFAANESSKQVALAVNADGAAESDELFRVTLSGASGSTSITGATADGTIRNDDTTPTISIATTDAFKVEGTGTSTTPFTFTVTRSGNLSGVTTVQYYAGGWSRRPATATDFQGNVMPSGTLTFSSGQASKVITVYVNVDSTREPNENFSVVIHNAVGATITNNNGDAKIYNDDTRVAAGTIGLDDAPYAPIIPQRDPLEWFTESGDSHDHSHHHEDHSHDHHHDAEISHEEGTLWGTYHTANGGYGVVPGLRSSQSAVFASQMLETLPMRNNRFASDFARSPFDSLDQPGEAGNQFSSWHTSILPAAQPDIGELLASSASQAWADGSLLDSNDDTHSDDTVDAALDDVEDWLQAME